MNSKTLWGIALVLALALALFAVGWLCGRSSAGGGAEAVQRTVAAESKTIQDHMDARFDRVEGKIDALLKIATTPPPEIKPVK